VLEHAVIPLLVGGRHEVSLDATRVRGPVPMT
jgi:hypothetical protein